MKNKKYTWVPDLPDVRDHLFSEKFLQVPASNLPTSVDLRSKMPPIFDQGQLGSCTGNALAGQMGFLHSDVSVFSRLFIYYGERVIEHTVNTDSGAQIRDGIKFLANNGAPSETLWPYDIAKFKTKPKAPVFKAAIPYKISDYTRLVTLQDMLSCLASGMPFVFGFTVYDSFESEQVAQSGILDLPKKGEKVLGGHAVEAVGYDQTTQRFIVRNSWGTSWGQEGYFTMPFSYLTNPNLASDFWVIRK